MLNNKYNAQEPKTNLSITKELIIDAGIEKPWQVLGPEFADAYKWASIISHSEGKGDSINGSLCSERGCSTTMGRLKEKILEYSDNEHLLSYQVYEGMPSMVKYGKNTWQLISLGRNKTKLTMRMELKIGGIGIMMKPMMKMKMSKMAQQTTEEFKYYVETGKPHQRKLKATKKYN